jgi:hypothetical protein
MTDTRTEKKHLRRRKLVAYAGTGSHFGPWVQMDDCQRGLRGQMAIFETYADALRSEGNPYRVHRVTMYIEQEPATP